MEYGDHTTLFYPGDKSKLTERAIEKEKQKAYYQEEGNIFGKEDSFKFLTDEELKSVGEEKRRNIQESMRKVFGREPILLDSFSNPERSYVGDMALTAREAAVAYGGVKIMSLSGQETSMYEYLGDAINQKVWEFEPHPNFEKEVARKDTEFDKKTHAVLSKEKGDNDKLWKYLEEEVNEYNEELSGHLDIKNLTPYEAVDLIDSLIRKRMNFEDIILYDDVSEAVEVVKNNGGKTSRGDILELSKTDPERAKEEIVSLRKKIDSMTADKLLEYRFGVCRHIAATSQKLYELLRERQEGLKMNGSYLVYHNEGYGEQEKKGLVEHHAYNVLVVTTPGDDDNVEASLSVLDPTNVVTGRSDFIDHTYERISQAVSFLSEYGDLLEVKKKDDICEHLADEAADRLKSVIISKQDVERFADFAALLIQSGEQRRSNVFREIKEVNKEIGKGEASFLNMMFELPIISREHSFGGRLIRNEFILPMSEEISRFSFVGETDTLDGAITLEKNIDYQVSVIKIDSFDKFEKNGLHSIDKGYLVIINNLVRACLELGTSPSEEALEVIMRADESEKKMKFGYIDLEMVEKLKDIP